MFFGHLLERREIVDSGIVHQDINLAKSFLGFRKKVLNLRLLRDIGLHRDSFAAAASNVGHYTVCTSFAGGIVDDHGRTLGGQVFSNGSSDALRGTGYDGYFVLKFAHFLLSLSVPLSKGGRRCPTKIVAPSGGCLSGLLDFVP